MLFFCCLFFFCLVFRSCSELPRCEQLARFVGLCVEKCAAAFARNTAARPLLSGLLELSDEGRRIVALDVARGLAHLHANNIVHGGLSGRFMELTMVRLSVCACTYAYSIV